MRYERGEGKDTHQAVDGGSSDGIDQVGDHLQHEDDDEQGRHFVERSAALGRFRNSQAVGCLSAHAALGEFALGEAGRLLQTMCDDFPEKPFSGRKTWSYVIAPLKA